VEVFQVNLQNIGTAPARTSRFYGILCVPRGDGPFPAMMIPPGAGIRKFHGQKTWAERGFITLEVGVHGIPVTLPEELYASLNGALGGYPRIDLDNRDRYYFRRVFMGCVRANDYLVAHPKWDHKNLIAFGGSQGGFLSIVTTALDSRVTALVAAFPAFCDVTGYAHGRAGGWPGMRYLADENEPARDAKIATTAYYDTVNFARRLKEPGHFGWGYNDETCPPTSTFSAYNVITSPKTLDIFKEMGHPRVPELTVREHDWVMNVGLKK
jgi:cephalosporin-C deacetylase